MNRDHRKISRSLEERNITASITRVSQISQTDNELKQKLQAINTSHNLSNKRIRNETRELKEILHGLQRELQVSKGIHTQYVPSLIEQPQRRPRRTTVSSVPSEDRKDVVYERDLQRLREDKDSDDMARRRSGSYPPSLHTHSTKKAKDVLDGEESTDKVLEERSEVKVVVEKPMNTQRTSEWKNDGFTTRAQDKIDFSRIEQEARRRTSRTGGEQKFPAKFSPNEQQGERKRSTSDAFRGRFVTNTDTSYLDSSLTSSSRRISQTQQKADGGRVATRDRLRPSIVEEFPVVPMANQREQRKTSLGMPQYPWQRKGSVGTRGNSPMASAPGRHDLQDAEVVFDALPDYLGGRRLSVAHGRMRKVSRGTGLPPLKEERVAQTEKTADNWSDLSKCRYLRKDEQEITIDDIFSKE